MIIFFHGADGYRSREKTIELKKQYLLKNPGGTGLFEYDFDSANAELTMKTLFETVDARGLFATRRFIIVRGLFQSSEPVRQSILGFLESRPDIMERESLTIILFWEIGIPKRNEKLYKFLENKALLQQSFEPLTGTALDRWAVAFLGRFDPPSTITREALRPLLDETGNDLFRLENDLSKLALYANGATITRDMVSVLIPAEKLRDTVFSALDALAGGDRKLALRLFAERAESGENALGMLGLCAWQLRLIYRVADAYHAQGLRTADAIARATGIKPFQIGKILRRIGGFPLERLRKGFALLSDFDAEAKSGGTDPALALEMFVMKF